MGTRATLTVFSETNKPLLSIYKQYDGYFEGFGQEIADFLKEMVIVNGFGTGTPSKAANGMGCLAAQLIKHFKEDIGGIYIIHPGQQEEYNYEIRLEKSSVRNGVIGGDGARITLVGKGYDKSKTFKLYDEIIPAPILRRVQFVYDKNDGDGAKWRTVDVTEENGRYLCGIEVGGKFKKFLVSRIVGGRILSA